MEPCYCYLGIDKIFSVEWDVREIGISHANNYIFPPPVNWNSVRRTSGSGNYWKSVQYLEPTTTIWETTKFFRGMGCREIVISHAKQTTYPCPRD